MVNSVEYVICMDNPSINSFKPSVNVMQFNYLMQMGKGVVQTKGSIPDIPSFRSNTLAITYTSGSTGCPKAVLFKEKQWLSQFSHFIAFRTSVLYGFYPMDHVTGRVDLYTALVNGGRIAFPSSGQGIDSFFADVQELRPTVFGLIPLLINAVYDQYHNELAKEKEKNPNTAVEELEKPLLEKYRYIFGNRLSSTKSSSAPISKAVANPCSAPCSAS